jgi:hypothetical protein
MMKSDEFFKCHIDTSDDDSPIILAWWGSIFTGRNPLVESEPQSPFDAMLSCINSKANADLQDLMRLFYDEPNQDIDDHIKSEVKDLKHNIAVQYIQLIEERQLIIDHKVKEYVVSQILEHFELYIPDSIVLSILNGTPFFSYDKLLNIIHQNNIRVLNPATLTFLLVSAGVDLCLPNIYLGKTYGQETVITDIIDKIEKNEPLIESESNIKFIKSKFQEELEEFRLSLFELSSGSYDLIKANDYKEAIRWAEFKAYHDIYASVLKLEASIRKHNKSLINRIKTGIFKGIPTIAQELKPGGNPVFAAINEILKILIGSLAEEEKKWPVATYIQKVRRDFPLRVG